MKQTLEEKEGFHLARLSANMRNTQEISQVDVDNEDELYKMNEEMTKLSSFKVVLLFQVLYLTIQLEVLCYQMGLLYMEKEHPNKMTPILYQMLWQLAPDIIPARMKGIFR